MAAPAANPNQWSHPATLSDEQLLAQCELSKGRSSGPGGQHRNKVETKVTLHHEPTGIIAQAGERRSVADNKRVALRRLRLLLATEHRCAVPAGAIGSELWRSRVRPGGAVVEDLGIPGVKARPRRLPGRIEVSPEHHDFPAILAEAMDALAAALWDPKDAALRLDVSGSQLLKLVKDHPPAFERLNRERELRGEHRLR